LGYTIVNNTSKDSYPSDRWQELNSKQGVKVYGTLKDAKCYGEGGSSVRAIWKCPDEGRLSFEIQWVKVGLPEEETFEQGQSR
jgi:hypothetical protein